MHAAFCMSSRTIADRPRIPIPAAAGRRPAWWSVGSAPKQRMAQCGKAIKICAFSAVCTDISQHKPHRCRWGSCILRGWGLHPSIIAVTCRGGGPTGKAHPVRVGGRQAGVGKVAGGRGGRRGPGSGRVVLDLSGVFGVTRRWGSARSLRYFASLAASFRCRPGPATLRRPSSSPSTNAMHD